MKPPSDRQLSEGGAAAQEVFIALFPGVFGLSEIVSRPKDDPGVGEVGALGGRLRLLFFFLGSEAMTCSFGL
jgi:hypothetical protein